MFSARSAASTSSRSTREPRRARAAPGRCARRGARRARRRARSAPGRSPSADEVALGDLLARGSGTARAWRSCESAERALDVGEAVVEAEVDHRRVHERRCAWRSRNCRSRCRGSGSAAAAPASSASSVVTTPPSPVVTCFTGWKLNVVRSASAPTGRPRYSAPSAWAASSITQEAARSRQRRRARRGRRAGRRSPPATIARVRGVIARLDAAGRG